jgi:hypothetical protein
MTIRVNRSVRFGLTLHRFLRLARFNASRCCATRTVLPSVDTAAMLFWALLASGQINMRKVDGWQTIAENFIGQPIDLAARIPDGTDGRPQRLLMTRTAGNCGGLAFISLYNFYYGSLSFSCGK